ncbi:MAG: sulfurtransferase TusA family protein [Candidatus Electrothrix sp. AR3]|nr:sulfurtransferase TusA family protein [Candidatus Electrothrix sp. AR3]
MADKFKDLIGVKCPLNFVKTKVELAAMDSGETLQIILDDGDPIENVPGSVQLEGHSILHEEKIGNQWTVVIEKV